MSGLLAQRPKTNMLRVLREGKGWSSRDVAERTGLGHATVTRAERRGETTIAHFIVLVRAYGLDTLADMVERVVRLEEP